MFPGRYGSPCPTAPCPQPQLGGLADDWNSFWSGLSSKAKSGLDSIKTAAGGEITQTGLASVITAFRPMAAKSLGKPEAATTDEEVLAYVSTIGTAGIADKVQAVVAGKIDTAIYVVGGGFALIALALYAGRRKA